MIRITLTTETREALQALRRDVSLSPGERDRIEMLFLSEEGWSAPQIALHLGCHPKTVRLALKGFLAHGASSLRHRPPGPAPDLDRKEQVTRTLDSLLGQERTWTAAQLAEALRQEGFTLSTRSTRRYLKAMGAGWRRTVRTLSHKQDEGRVERARSQLATLKKKAALGRLVLTYLDESDFAPTCPVSYSWSRRLERKRVAFENPEGRRLNLLAALDRTGPEPGIYWVSKPKGFDSQEFVRFLLGLPVVPVPRVVVIDNGSLHKNATVRAAMADLWKRRIYLYYLPPYSPELNDIEPVFRNLKHNEMPERSYRTIPDLKDAVDHGLTNMEAALIAKCQPQLRLAAYPLSTSLPNCARSSMRWWAWPASARG